MPVAARAAAAASPPPRSSPGGWADAESASRLSSSYTALFVLIGFVFVFIAWMKLCTRPRKPRGRDAAMIRVTRLFIYPVKSCAGIPVQSLEFDRLGVCWDRRFLIVSSATNRMVSQREYPKLALVAPAIDIEGDKATLTLTFPQQDPLVVPLRPAVATDAAESAEVDVFGTKIEALLYTDPRVSAWFHRVLQLPEDRAPFRLGTILGTKEHTRFIERQFDRNTPVDASTSSSASGDSSLPIAPAFHDEFPLNVASESSLAAVNEWTVPNGRRVEIEAFRPNIVVAGAALKPWAEDFWRRIRIGPAPPEPTKADLGKDGRPLASRVAALLTPPKGVEFFVAKAAARCVLPNVIPFEGRFHPSGEPLTALRAHRKMLEHVPSQKGGAFFAQHLLPLPGAVGGVIHVGDVVGILERRMFMYDPAPGKEPESDREVVAEQNRQVEEARKAAMAAAVQAASMTCMPTPSPMVKKDQ